MQDWELYETLLLDSIEKSAQCECERHLIKPLLAGKGAVQEFCVWKKMNRSTRNFA